MRKQLRGLWPLAVLLIVDLGVAAAQPLPIAPGQTHFAKGVYPVAADLTFDEPVTLDEGAVLDLAKGVAVTFRGAFTAGAGQVFAGEGDVRGLHRLTPEWFGARGDGKADDTVAFQKTLDSFADHGFWEREYKGHDVLVLRNAYRLSSVSVNVNYLNIQSENAWLIAMEEGAHPWLVRFTKQFCSINGYLSVEGSYNLGYECMVNVNTRHFSAHNVNVWRANLAWRFGRLEWGVTDESAGMSEQGDSEIEIIGGATIYCLRGIEAIGSNTVVTFTDALVYSYPWTLPEGDARKAAWENADATIIRCYGALVYYTGGQLCNTSSRTPVVEVQPLRNTKPDYFSHYGGAYLANTHVESGYLFRAVNPRQIRQQDSQGKPLVPDPFVSLAMTGCGGYVRDERVAVETDPLFTGTLVVSACNFYGPRFGTFAKLDNPLATIQVDEVSLRNKWTGGLSAIQGGAPLFNNRRVLEARLARNLVLGQESANLPFGEFVAAEDSGHFRDCYDPATGVFTVPPGGLSQATVNATLTLAETPDGGPVRLAVLRNGKEVFAVHSSGPSGWVIFRLGKLVSGDRLAVAARAATGTREVMAVEGTALVIEASRF